MTPTLQMVVLRWKEGSKEAEEEEEEEEEEEGKHATSKVHNGSVLCFVSFDQNTWLQKGTGLRRIFAFRPVCCLHFGPFSKEKQFFWAKMVAADRSNAQYF